MKKFKHMLCLVLTMCLLCTLTPVNAKAATSSNTPFSDVYTDQWYCTYVEYSFKHGLMNGITSTTFNPNGNLTRAMLVTILYRLNGSPAAPASSFSDVPAGQWYSKAIGWAASNNIVNGLTSSSFGPDVSITREQTATILYRYSTQMSYDTTGKADLDSYPDYDKISDWAAEAMQWTVNKGLINGDGGLLKPNGTASRAQIAAILNRFCSNIIPNFYSEYDKAMNAYAQTLRNFSYNSGSSSTIKFSLVYLDANHIPELVIVPGGFHLAQANVYTWYNNSVVYLGAYGMYGTLPHTPWANAFGDYSAPVSIRNGQAVSISYNTNKFIEISYYSMYARTEANISKYLLGK